MKRIHTLIVASAVVFAIGLALRVPQAAAGFCCKSSQAIKLVSTDPTIPLRLKRGMAEIDECLGMSFLRVTVSGNVPDGSAFVVSIPGREPILGEFFSVIAGHGETVLQGIMLGSITGRVVEVSDDTFTPVLTGQF